jgi:hypothetical protein
MKTRRGPTRNEATVDVLANFFACTNASSGYMMWKGPCLQIGSVGGCMSRT